MKYKIIDKSFETFTLTIKDSFLDTSNKTIFKQRNTIKVIEFNSKRYAVKSFKIPHLLNRLVYKNFRASKAARSYENSVKLCALDVNTPAPIGYIEFDSAFALKESYYIAEFFDYDFEIRELIHYEEHPDRDRIIKEFISFTYDLHNKGVYHVDFSPGNIIIKKVNNNYQFFIIDVNRMEFKNLDLNLRMKNLAKISPNESFNKHMVKEYSIISGLDYTLLQEKLDFHLDEQQKYLQRKQRIKHIIKR